MSRTFVFKRVFRPFAFSKGLLFSTCHRRSLCIGAMDKQRQDKKLFTPGPLGVSYETKASMIRDLGSRDKEFMDTVSFIRQKLLEIAGTDPSHYCAVPLQGSGTYAVEAVISCTVPRAHGKLLVIINGSYGRRMTQIAKYLNIETIALEGAENEKANLAEVESILKSNPGITNVAMVHCETSSGVIHPVEEVGQLVQKHTPQATFFVDAMSSFGAVPLRIEENGIDFLVSSANKCIEGVPGFSYVIANKEKLLAGKGLSRSLSLDIVDQYIGLENTGQFRFTPPVQAIIAFKTAILALEAEGGVKGRAARYKENRRILREGMKEFGFREFLDESHTGYIITSFYFPSHPKFDFRQFYTMLSEKGQVIYPGKVTEADCFRIGNIGHLFPSDMQVLLRTIKDVCGAMGMELPLKESS